LTEQNRSIVDDIQKKIDHDWQALLKLEQDSQTEVNQAQV
jgi:hypothetical protein